MVKETIRENLYEISIENGREIRFSEIKEYLSDDSFLTFYCFDENIVNLEIFTEREETDEEFDLRIEKNKRNKEALRERRYQNYLALKSEFENQ
jgi:hypothetical protein